MNAFQSILCALFVCVLGADSDLESLKQKAEAVLNAPQAEKLLDLDTVVEYADALAEQGQDDEALEIYARVVRAHPWRMDCQLGAARILKKKGDAEEAKKILAPLLRYMENDAEYVDACREIGQPVDPALPPLEKLPGTNYAVVILPVGEVENVLLKEVAGQVSDILGIPVFVQDSGLALPEADVTGFASVAKEIMSAMRMEEEFCKLVLQKLASRKLQEEDLLNPEHCRFVFTELMKEDGVPSEEIEARLQMTADYKQWSASRLVDLVDKRSFPYQRPNVYYVGLTKADITTGDFMFIFSRTYPGYAIASYCRFLGDFMGEPPDRERLARRIRIAVMQCIGNMFDLDPCSNPSCPVSYQNSLPEHDAKSDKFCQKCAEKFKEAIRHNSLGTQTWSPPAPPPMGLRF